MANAQALAPVTDEHHGVDRRLLTFLGVLAAIFLSALDQTIVGTALPKIVSDLNGFDRYTWITTAYLLTSTAVVPVVGKLSEQLGRKKVFLTGIVMFLAGSALCGAAQGMNQLILFRGVQGIGGGVLTGTAFAIIADLFSPAERGKYTGMVAGMFGLASIVGPLVGGYLTDNVGWRYIFYVNLPIGALVLLGLALTFPSLKRDQVHPRIDYRGAVGFGLGAAMLTLGASLVSLNSWGYPPVWILLAAGTVAIAATVVHESRIPETAVIPPQLFRSSIFSLSMIVTFLTGGLMFGTIIYIPLFLQGVVGVSATNSGILLLPLMAGLVAGSIGGGFLVSKTGRYKIQAIVGFAFMAFGMFLLSLLKVNSGEAEVARDMIAVGLGLGLTMPVFNVISQNAVDIRFMSSATSSIQFIRQMGGVLGLAVLGAVFSESFKSNIKGDINPVLAQRLLQDFPSLDLGNVQKLFGSGLHDLVKSAATPIQKAELFQAFQGLKLALTDTIVSSFVISLGIALVALMVILFIHEIPLSTKRGYEGPAGGQSKAGDHVEIPTHEPAFL
ncbi:MAG: MDR family MFS transporter [Candidatus Dormibacteria bacterium]